MSTMNEINRFFSNDLLQDIFNELKKETVANTLREKYFKDDRFIYYDNRYRRCDSSSFILFRNAFDSYSDVQQEMIMLCRCLNVNQSVTYYALELFDKFFENLLSNAQNGYLKYVKLTENFGICIGNLTNMKLRSDSIYSQLIYDREFISYSRVICMAICIFIGSKQSDYNHLGLFRIRSLLHELKVPKDLCKISVLAIFEEKLLNIVKFELNLTTLNTHVETIWLILSRYFTQDGSHRIYLSSEKIGQIESISHILVENYYMLRVSFLINLFQTLNGCQFNICRLEDVEEIENLNRNKLLIGSAIIAATCSMIFGDRETNIFVSFISTISGFHIWQIKRSSVAVLKYLFVRPLEEYHQPLPTTGHESPMTIRSNSSGSNSDIDTFVY